MDYLIGVCAFYLVITVSTKEQVTLKHNLNIGRRFALAKENSY